LQSKTQFECDCSINPYASFISPIEASKPSNQRAIDNKIMSRITTRIFLGIALILAVVVVGLVLLRIGPDVDSVGATIAGALAVITAVISAFGAQRVVELEEDRQKPYPYPSFDLSSRFGLVLFRIENSGESAAHDISIQWSGEPLSSEGKEVRFSPDGDKVQVPVLLPGQAISKLVDGHVQFFQSGRKHQYAGKISFKDAHGRKYSHDFRMDAGMYLGTPSHPEEAIKTHFELQKIPEHLAKLEAELKRIRSAMESNQKETKR
jgi:hypothetical protein